MGSVGTGQWADEVKNVLILQPCSKSFLIVYMFGSSLGLVMCAWTGLYDHFESVEVRQLSLQTQSDSEGDLRSQTTVGISWGYIQAKKGNRVSFVSSLLHHKTVLPDDS